MIGGSLCDDTRNDGNFCSVGVVGVRFNNRRACEYDLCILDVQEHRRIVRGSGCMVVSCHHQQLLRGVVVGAGGELQVDRRLQGLELVHCGRPACSHSLLAYLQIIPL